MSKFSLNFNFPLKTLSLLKCPARCQRVICEQHINSGHNTEPGILQAVRYLTANLRDLAIFLL